MGRDLFLVFVGFPVLLSGEETFPLAFVRNLPVVLYGEETFSLVFVGFPVALSGERLLFPSICEEFVGGAILEEASFPLAFLAFLAFGSFGTGYGLLWYATHFQGHSV